MSEPDVRQIITSPDMVFGSDSSIHYRGLGRPHPRGAGTFPRVFAEYARDQKLLTLEEAVHHATGLAAEIFALPNRGFIREGDWADAVIFDPARIQDRASFEDPWLPPDGIAAVIVNGQVAVRESKLTGSLAGRPVPRAAGEGPVKATWGGEIRDKFELGTTLLTPSPGPLRLEKAPVAVHALPPKGRGR
jgi:dihydroorotase/N-acyl-D-amino-acid deacylase